MVDSIAIPDNLAKTPLAERVNQLQKTAGDIDQHQAAQVVQDKHLQRQHEAVAPEKTDEAVIHRDGGKQGATHKREKKKHQDDADNDKKGGSGSDRLNRSHYGHMECSPDVIGCSFRRHDCRYRRRTSSTTVKRECCTRLTDMLNRSREEPPPTDRAPVEIAATDHTRSHRNRHRCALAPTRGASRRSTETTKAVRRAVRRDRAGRAEKYLEAVRMYRQGSDKGHNRKSARHFLHGIGAAREDQMTTVVAPDRGIQS